MSFKILILLFLATSCGVKGNPSPPKGTVTPSVLDNYPDIEVDTPLRDNKKR